MFRSFGPRPVFLACLLSGCEVTPGLHFRSDWDGGGGTTGACSAEFADANGEARCAPGTPVLACDVTNARDLGGMPLAPSGNVACGALFRGPPLTNLTAGGCDAVARLGIQTVIDLRTDDERFARPDDACVRANVVLAQLPIPYAVSPTDYLADFDTTASIAQVFHVLADPTMYPVYFHCTWGRDRTGVVAAAVLLALGASREDVMQEYSLSMATVGAFPDSLAAVLDEIERRGGIEASLLAAGVPTAELATLRARAVVP